MADNHNYMCHICEKVFLDFNKISNFYEIDPNFTYTQKLLFFK